MRTYRLIQRFLRFSMGIFFRRLVVVGEEHIPQDGPVIFAGNHPNSLLDPALIVSTCGRIVHFAAKDVLFRSRLLRPVLLGLGAVPLQRRKDHGDGPLDNESAFTRLYDVLDRGGVMGIFPEGISHDNAQLARLKTGAARIALGAAAREGIGCVRIVPCGLHYVRRRRFRSSVLVQYGPPIEVDAARVEAWRADEKGCVRALTDQLDQSLRGLTVNADGWDTLRVLDGVRRLYQPPRITLAERIELARRFNNVYPDVQEEPEVQALFERVRLYLDRLDDAGITDRDLNRGLKASQAISRLGRHLFLLLFWFPLAIIGSVLHVPAGFLLGWSGDRLAPRQDVIATSKFVLGFLGLGLVYWGGSAAAAYLFGWRIGLLTLVGLPLSGYATLRALERGAAIERSLITLVRLIRFNTDLASLRVERAALEEAVVEAVDRFKPEDMVALFPRSPRP